MAPRDPDVFISYARADEGFATELVTRLQKVDLPTWQDRIRMRPGDFEDQIKQGIDAATHFVLVMTPAALRSPWVEREWRYARENGRCIVPIKPDFASPAVDTELDALRATLPVWMQKIQIYDFGPYWKQFVNVLQSPCQATRTPFLAATLPSNFVDRPEEFHRIVHAVLDDGHKNPAGTAVVLCGTGGFGKTTMALRVCHDPDVFAACDGGILWVTLGEQPSIVTELEQIYAALTGERPGFKNQDDAMFAVGRKLEGKRCLIVVDDVWNMQDLKPFLHGGSSSTRLITTRIFKVALDAANDANRIDIGAPNADEAAAMLSAGVPVPDASLVHVRQLASRVKRVPLLLQLANRTLVEQIALGQSVDDALHWALQRYKDLGVVAFDDNAVARRDAIAKTVEVSLGRLADERQRCLDLGVLHEDTDVPFRVLGTLWNVKDTDVQVLAQRLHNFGLVVLNLPGRSIRMHDFIRQYFESQLSEPASVHGRLVEAWKNPAALPGGYAVQHVVYHLVETLTGPQQIVPRSQQLIALLNNPRYGEYQRQHGDATALDRKLTLAIQRAAESPAPQVPALIASLVLLRRSYAAKARDAALVFQCAAQGRINSAAELLTLFEADRHWDTLARLVIAWGAPAGKAGEAKAFAEDTAKSCDVPQLQTALAWVRHALGGPPPVLREISGGPDLRYVSAILQRAGGAEKLEGLEPLNYEDLVSGTDATGFIAERDGPDLVAFARLNPESNTQYLERYIDIHAANRYVHYRNRSLWMLLEPILRFPDALWVRRMVERIVTAALTVASVDFEEFLPLAVRGVLAHANDALAGAELEQARQRLIRETDVLLPDEGRTDSWSHFHRRAAALAEIFAVALDRRSDAAALAALARGLPKGFAGFRAFSALTLAESTRIAAPDDPAAREAALTSARAASHRIQDHRFCLQVTAMVNAMRARWADIRADELEAIVDRFLERPLDDEFCAVHYVLENFEYRDQDQQQFQALPIPPHVRVAKTLGDIVTIFDYEPEALVRVNGWIWAGSDGALAQELKAGDEVNIPDPEFVPILAARFAAEALVADGLASERRSLIIQRLVRPSLTNPTALNTVLGRLMLSTLDRPTEIPAMLKELDMTGAPPVAGAAEQRGRLALL
jgi:hypothetical protein